MTLLASPRRGSVLAAKAVLLGVVTFVAGTTAAALVIPLASGVLRDNGLRQPGLPLTTITPLALDAGLLVAGTALLTLGLGALLRPGHAAVGVAVTAVVLPYLAATLGGLPTAASQWLLRLSPAAAFAFQQVSPEYPHVLANYTPGSGFYPLPAWSGLAVLAGYAALALGLASAPERRVIRVLHAEWTKLRTDPAAGRLLPGIVVSTVLMSLLAVAAARCERGGCDYDAAALSLTGIQLGQALVVLLAVLAVGGEQDAGLLRTTFTAAPRRTVVLAAKAALLLGAIFLRHRDA